MEPASQAQRFLCWELHPQRGFAQEGPAEAEVTSASGISAFQAGKKERGLQSCGGFFLDQPSSFAQQKGRAGWALVPDRAAEMMGNKEFPLRGTLCHHLYSAVGELPKEGLRFA